MSSIQEYKYPREHVFDGYIYHFALQSDVLKKTKEELQLDPSDIVIATYPKSGTTWMQEMLYSIVTGPEDAAKRTAPIDDIFLFIEMQQMRDGIRTLHYDRIASTPPPRLLKTHLNCSFYQRQLQNAGTCPKFIVVLRNPKDTLVSYYRWHRMITPLKFHYTWDDFFEKFKMKTLVYGDVIDFSTSWWPYRDHPNVLLLRYEDMLADNEQAIRQVAEFVKQPLETSDIEKIREQASFQKMRERGFASYHTNPFVSEKEYSFFGSGKSGGWRQYFSAEQSAYMDEVLKSQCESLGLCFNDDQSI